MTITFCSVFVTIAPMNGENGEQSQSNLVAHVSIMGVD